MMILVIISHPKWKTPPFFIDLKKFCRLRMKFHILVHRWQHKAAKNPLQFISEPMPGPHLGFQLHFPNTFRPNSFYMITSSTLERHTL